MKRIIGMAVALVALWVLLSARFTPLLLCLGAASVLATVVIAYRMNIIDHESHPFHLSARLPRFWFLLFVEIAKANVDVTLRILGFRPISPTVVNVPSAHKTDLARVMHANAITLTPGTASMVVGDDEIIVHAISAANAAELKKGALAAIVPDIAAPVTEPSREPSPTPSRESKS